MKSENNLKSENNPFRCEEMFYEHTHITRISRLLAHYEAMRMTADVPGAIIECGVFRGVSLIRFAALRELLGSTYSRQIIGFDIFDAFPHGRDQTEQQYRDAFVRSCGERSIAENELLHILQRKHIGENVELVAGDITTTVPEYVRANPHVRISILNIDVDLYEPTRIILESLYPLVSSGGVILFDDYGAFPGETEAVEKFFSSMAFQPKRFPFGKNPTYLVKT